MTNKQKRPDYLYGIYLDVNLYTGGKKNTANDIGAKRDKELAKICSFGHHQTYPRKYLKAYDAIKKAAERALNEKGSRCDIPKVWVFPYQDINSALAELDKLKGEFYALKATERDRFIARRQEHARDNPKYADLILKHGTDGWAEMDRQLRFSAKLHQFGTMKAVNEEDLQMLQSGTAALIDSVFDRLLDETAAVAKKVLEALKGKRTDKRTTSPLSTISEKLTGLAFIDPRIEPIASAIDKVCGLVPDQGALPLDVTEALTKVLSLLGDTDKLRKELDGGGNLLDGIDAVVMAAGPEELVMVV